jgi:hypothetical protein
MRNLLTDLINLTKNNWKAILVVALAFYIIHSYTDIKLGIMDGLMGK